MPQQAFIRLMDRIADLENELDSLTSEAEDLAQTYTGNAFDGQNDLALLLEQKMQALTHENASSIGFERQQTEELERFICFRTRHAAFDDVALRAILDAETMPLPVKLALSPAFSDGKALIHNSKALREEWNREFPDKTYAVCAQNYQSPKCPYCGPESTPDTSA